MNLANRAEVLLEVGNITTELNDICRTTIESLLEASPCDSNLSGLFQRSKKGYKGVLKVISSQGVFVAKATSKNLIHVFDLLKTKIQEQLTHWKKSRFFENTDSLAEVAHETEPSVDRHEPEKSPQVVVV